MKALIIVDIQNDFTTGGALEVRAGETIIPLVNRIQKKFDLVIATQDWHPANHKSFASQHPGKKPFETITLDGLSQVLWPDHCVQGNRGAEFHPDLHMSLVEAVFRKGMDTNIDSYSGLYDNGHRKSTGLAGYLRDRAATEVFVCGLAADFCVYFTAKDLLKERFTTYFITDATLPISADGLEMAKADLAKAQGRIITSSEL